MWGYNNAPSGDRGRRPYTVTPGTAHRIDYHPNYVPPPKPMTEQEKALQRLGSSNLPLGYYTTRKVIPQTQPTIPAQNYFYGYQQQPSQPGYATYPEPQQSLASPQQSPYNKQYNSPIGNRTMSAISVLQQPKQAKQAPVKKRIERKTKRDSISAQSTSSSSLQNYKPKSVSEDDNPVIQIDDGFDNPFGNQNNENHSDSDSQESVSDKEEEQNKFDTVRSNKSGGSSVRFANKPLHIQVPDYRGNDSSTSTDNDKASGSYQGSFPQDTRHDYPKVDPPTYSSVLKRDNNTNNLHTSSNDNVQTKDDEPVYSTISEKQDTTKKEPPKRNLSVLDELKQRFASKLHLKSKSAEDKGDTKGQDNNPYHGTTDINTQEIHGATQTSSSTDVSAVVPNKFNPEAVSPPAPPPPPPLQTNISSGNPTLLHSASPPLTTSFSVVQPSSVPAVLSHESQQPKPSTTPPFSISAPPPPPPPNFIPPPPPSQLTSSSQDNILPANQVEQQGTAIATSFNAKQDSVGTASENSDNQQKAGSSQVNSGSDSSSQIDSDTESEGSSSEDETENGKIKSILKNRDETPLVDPDKVTVYSESDDDNNTIIDKDSSENPNSEDIDDNSMDRRGVSFTRDTLDNEGTGKQYEKEGVNISDIYKGKISSKNAIAKPNPIYDENDNLPPVPVVQPTEDDKPPSKHSSETSTSDNKDMPNHIYDKPKSILKTNNGGSSQNLENIGNGGQPKSILKSSDSKNKLPDIITNGDVPNRKTSLSGPKSPTLSGSLSQSSEMYYSLKRRPDNISVINITQDGEEGDNISIADEVFTGNSLQRNGFNMDTMRSNYSTGTMRTTISLGSAGDLADIHVTPSYFTTPSPGNDNFAFAYPPNKLPAQERPDKVLNKKSRTKDRKKAKSSKNKKQKKSHTNNHNPNTTFDKKTTFADQALGFDAQIIRAKHKRRNQKIFRITSFVLVVLLIIIGTVVTIYFLTANDSPEVNTTTSPSISG